MLKTLKHLRFTFPSVLLLVLCAISCIIFLTQVAFAQTTTAETTVRATTTAEVERPFQPLPQNASSTPRERNAEVRMNAEATVANRMAAAEERKEAFETARAERQAALTAKQTEIEARKTARVATLEAQVQSRVLDLSENMTDRFTRVVGRLFDIAGKLGARIEARKAAGVDTSEAEALLAEANATITEIRSALASIDVEITYVITSDTPRADWTEARQEFIYIRDLIKEAHELLRSTVAALKVAEALNQSGPGVSAAVQQSATSTIE